MQRTKDSNRFPTFHAAGEAIRHLTSWTVTALVIALLLLSLGATGCRGAASDDGDPADTAGEQSNAEPTDPRAVNALTREEIDDGWILLFDGETLFGWASAGDANWRVERGLITADRGKPCLLHTTGRFGDYILSLDFRLPEGGNSGMFLRSDATGEDVTGGCYELNIADATDNEFPTGSMVERKKAEVECDNTQWHTYQVRAEGGHFEVRLDGEMVLGYEDSDPLPSGYIALQYRQGPIEFCNIKLKPLGMIPLFNGKDLTGWKEYPEMASRFTVTPEGWLNVTDGRGQLETEERFGDFVFRIDVRVNGDELNSGIFFRCIPGEQMNGYECQIHNGYVDGDRTSPKDCGTGGIFRRQDARKIVADDHQWFTLTLLADGPHMAAWVDGHQVSDWTDTREPDPNPRRGLRLEPGTIMIQGHDPTTDLDFRNIEIAPMRL